MVVSDNETRELLVGLPRIELTPSELGTVVTPLLILDNGMLGVEVEGDTAMVLAIFLHDSRPCSCLMSRSTGDFRARGGIAGLLIQLEIVLIESELECGNRRLVVRGREIDKGNCGASRLVSTTGLRIKSSWVLMSMVASRYD